jgi:hypothetical protein
VHIWQNIELLDNPNSRDGRALCQLSRQRRRRPCGCLTSMSETAPASTYRGSIRWQPWKEA